MKKKGDDEEKVKKKRAMINSSVKLGEFKHKIILFHI